MKIKKICKQCGKEFEVTSYNFKSKRKKYCSLQCRYNSQKGWKLPRELRICLNCGKIFYWRKATPTNTGKYCSKKCKHELGAHWKGRGKVEVKCEYCGKSMIRPLWRIEKSKNYFCNGKCHLNWQWENPKQIFKFYRYKLFKNMQLTELDKEIIRTRVRLFKIQKKEVIKND